QANSGGKTIPRRNFAGPELRGDRAARLAERTSQADVIDRSALARSGCHYGCQRVRRRSLEGPKTSAISGDRHRQDVQGEQDRRREIFERRAVSISRLRRGGRL